MTNWIIGGAIVLFIVRQVREKFLEQLRDDRPTTRRDLAALAASAASNTPFGAAGVVLSKDETDDGSPKERAGWGARVSWVVSAGVRLAFFVWLWDVTDGAALSPFGWAGDAFGGTVWQPALVALGLTEVVGRGGAIAVRKYRGNHPAYGEQLVDSGVAAGPSPS